MTDVKIYTKWKIWRSLIMPNNLQSPLIKKRIPAEGTQADSMRINFSSGENRLTYILKRYKMLIYLHAKIKSALWLGPTYLYSARASQTTSRKLSLLTTIVIRLLFNWNGTLLVLPSFPASKWLPTSVLSKQPVVRQPSTFAEPTEASNLDMLVSSGSKASLGISLLIISNTLRLIWSEG